MVSKVHLLPDDGEEDYAQDNVLANLEGKKRKDRRQGRIRQLSYGLRPRAGDIPAWGNLDEINFDAIERLADYLLGTEARITAAILEYLDDPGDRSFFRVVGILQLKLTPFPKKGSLIEMMLRSMPTKLDDLYDMARNSHDAKRPEAAVRANLRNLMDRGEVVLDDEGTYKRTRKRRKRDNPRKSKRAS